MYKLNPERRTWVNWSGQIVWRVGCSGEIFFVCLFFREVFPVRRMYILCYSQSPYCPLFFFISLFQFSSVACRVPLFATPWTAARQASLSITHSWSLLKLMSITSVIPSNHLILYHPLLLPLSIFPSIRGFSSESVLHMQPYKLYVYSLLFVSSTRI